MTKTYRTDFVTRAFLVFVAALAVGTFIPANGQTCDKTSDQMIVDAINQKFAADDHLSSQTSRLNVTVVREPVSGAMQAWKVEGWVETDKDFQRVTDILLQVYSDLNGGKCFGSLKFNFNQLYTSADVPDSLKAGGGCVGDTKACGDICIPVSESCNIKAGMTKSN